MFFDMQLSNSDQKLLTDVNAEIVRFVNSEEKSLQLEPMNSYRRRLVHKIGSEFKLSSKSIFLNFQDLLVIVLFVYHLFLGMQIILK